MILRLTRARARPEQIVSLCALLDAGPGTPEGEPRGLVRHHLGSRKGDQLDDVLMISFWTTFEAAAEADARETSPFAIARRELPGVVEALHYEIDESILRHSEEQPVALRVGLGSFSKPASDIEMMDLLRQRAPLIGDEMTEAYVGRRMAGRQIEVVFVSAWRALPPDRPLDEAFWPDIALRYDAFEVEVYTAVMPPRPDDRHGAGAGMR